MEAVPRRPRRLGGDRHGVDDAFCAGGDLRDYLPLLTAAGPDDRAKFRSGTEAVLRDLDIYKPIIAAVNGPCVAGGMELLNGTDIRLACPEAVFGMLEPSRGIFASGGTTARLPRQIPWPAAMEFLLTAEPIPATRALEMGLLNEIVPRHRLLDRAHEWAARIAANAPLAVAATKESSLRGMAAGTLEEALRIEARLSAGCSTATTRAKDRVPSPRSAPRAGRGPNAPATTTGIGRLVLAWYASYRWPLIEFTSCQRRAKSGSSWSTIRARAG